jgi:IclR family mhp operon transcriptional activator
VVEDPNVAEPDNSTYGSVRALRRGLDILAALGRNTRTVAEIAAETQLNRTSVYRLLTTLEQVGYVRRYPDGTYRPTHRTLALSAGVGPVQRVTEVAEPILRMLTKEVAWPANLLSYDSGRMVVQASTHRLPSQLKHRDMTGQRIPMLSSAGKSYLAYRDPVETSTILKEVVTSVGSGLVPYSAEQLRRAAINAQIQGYSVGVEEVERGITGLAVPVRFNGFVVASVNLVTASSMPLPDLLSRNLAALRSVAHQIEEALEAS